MPSQSVYAGEIVITNTKAAALWTAPHPRALDDQCLRDRGRALHRVVDHHRLARIRLLGRGSPGRGRLPRPDARDGLPGSLARDVLAREADGNLERSADGEGGRGLLYRGREARPHRLQGERIGRDGGDGAQRGEVHPALAAVVVGYLEGGAAVGAALIGLTHPPHSARRAEAGATSTLTPRWPVALRQRGSGQRARLAAQLASPRPPRAASPRGTAAPGGRRGL